MCEEGGENVGSRGTGYGLKIGYDDSRVKMNWLK